MVRAMPIRRNVLTGAVILTMVVLDDGRGPRLDGEPGRALSDGDPR